MKTRTMVSLEREQLKALKARARSKRISLAELIRRLVKEHLEEPRPSPRVSPEAYKRIVALGSSEQPDIAAHHDAYLSRAIKRAHAG